ncbi:hypothetical protein SDC9_36751 [bioreactor metagenome]|uniref:5-methylcytosine-specific restriction enzyme subunit McrC n=1 Tax=bioreactor metagenome TaxID=1076179 RepID=A0A644VHA8_9ZZZZ
MRTTYQITEYGSFISGKEVPGYTTLPENTFSQLEAFILSNKSRDTDALEFLGLSAKKGLGKVITARNYVGIITMKDGTSIEILPKVYSGEAYTDTMVKKLLIDMLKCLRNTPYKALQTSTVNIEKMSVFEVFVRMFVDEVFNIVKRGLRQYYEAVEDNCGEYKGKILFSEHIKRNYAHKERCYVEFDDYNCNRPENKLLKATLQYLNMQSQSSLNKRDIKTLLNAFADVEPSTDHNSDFQKCSLDRNMKDYATALLWCKVFLSGKSFTSFSGSEVALALLFPMETLFESYVAVRLKKILGTTDFLVVAQDRSYHLFDYPNNKFLMKPDIVVHRKRDNSTFILDTKWKILSSGKSNYGISQSDMYQMYAYHKKYAAANVCLLYPKAESILSETPIHFRSKDEVQVGIEFIDLFKLDESLLNIKLALNAG